MLSSGINECFAKLFQMFLFHSSQINSDDIVADLLIQRYGSILFYRCIFIAEVAQASLFIANHMFTAKLILINQLHCIRWLHQRITPSVGSEDFF